MIEECKYCHFYFVSDHGGACRRFPPQLEAQTENSSDDPLTEQARFPRVHDLGWCGEYKKSTHHQDKRAEQEKFNEAISEIAQSRTSQRRDFVFWILGLMLALMAIAVWYFS